MRAGVANEEAGALFEGALAIHEALGNLRGQGHVLRNFGVFNDDLGRLALARAQFEEACAMCREVGDSRAEARVLASLGLIDYLEGR